MIILPVTFFLFNTRGIKVAYRARIDIVTIGYEQSFLQPQVPAGRYQTSVIMGTILDMLIKIAKRKVPLAVSRCCYQDPTAQAL